MYQIATIDLADELVTAAYEAVVKDRQEVLPQTGGRYQLITENNSEIVDGGNPDKSILVIIGHGSPEGVSEKASWKRYVDALYEYPDPAKTIYIASCFTAAEGSLFFYGCFANSVKDSCYWSPTVFASTSVVDAYTLRGDWTRL